MTQRQLWGSMSGVTLIRRSCRPHSLRRNEPSHTFLPDPEGTPKSFGMFLQSCEKVLAYDMSCEVHPGIIGKRVYIHSYRYPAHFRHAFLHSLGDEKIQEQPSARWMFCVR